MRPDNIQEILTAVQSGKSSVEDALRQLKDLPYTDLGFAMLDNHRELRVGYPEIVYCAGKTIEQTIKILQTMLEHGNNVMGTRASREVFDAVKSIVPDADYFETARIIAIRRKPVETAKTSITVVTAGTSDIPEAEEAAVTAELFGNPVSRVYDAGVAGIHRLFAKIDIIHVPYKAYSQIVTDLLGGQVAMIIGGPPVVQAFCT